MRDAGRGVQDGAAQVSENMTRTQTVPKTGHFFAALGGHIKLELLKSSTKLNHFALKSKLQLRAVQVAFVVLRELHPVCLAVKCELCEQ